MSGSVAQLVAIRAQTHGEWPAQAAIATGIKDLLRSGESYPAMTPGQREAVEMIAAKLSRIVSGDPAHPDHWRDVAGYAALGGGEAAP